MVTFTLTTPVNVGSLTTQINISSVQITGLVLSTKPALAALGAAEMSITLTDPVSGWQHTVTYSDASVAGFFAQLAPAPPAGATLADVLASALFGKLIADKRLPPGTLTTT